MAFFINYAPKKRKTVQANTLYTKMRTHTSSAEHLFLKLIIMVFWMGNRRSRVIGVRVPNISVGENPGDVGVGCAQFSGFCSVPIRVASVGIAAELVVVIVFGIHT